MFHILKTEPLSHSSRAYIEIFALLGSYLDLLDEFHLMVTIGLPCTSVHNHTNHDLDGVMLVEKLLQNIM